jgi:chromosome segregation ATPase
MYSVLNDLKTNVQGVKTDSARINDVHQVVTNTNINFNQLQQALARIETNMQGANNITPHLQQVSRDVAGLQQVLSNLEQFMGDMSQYLQSLQDQVSRVTTSQQQLQQGQQTIQQQTHDD